ncbi:N-acetyltransferase [Flexivirga endophytica]|uniref:N-acetyltransferase n=1 Tax=Flexivirga endophytica TaxID=1849103 RepID=A0A916X1E2_9MICO|nr:GNAT family N-acetyltransferase [Flexivirga endophytica]GGB46778.1 N-acetyltransferase [Flexivirga endophytica]GHB70841.1 N-acetyltransferase [Flexivirga endophytica]
MTDDIPVRDNLDQSRYEARIGGLLAGFAVYRLSEGRITFVHTEVDPKFESKGVGSAIARYALDEVRSTGERSVVPDCPFIKAWIDRHPDYQSLVRQD